MPEVPAINVDGLRALLGETAASISAEAVAAVRSHISEHLDVEGERWLRQGVGYAKGGRDCPYCGQTLDGSTLATLFPTFFDESYRRLQEKIAKAIDRVSAWEAWSVAVSRAQASNQRAWSAWSQLASLPEPPDAGTLATSAAEVVTLLRALMLDKQAHLLDPMGEDDRVTRMTGAVGAMRGPIDAYQSWVLAATELTRRMLSDHAGTLQRLRGQVGGIRAAVLAGSPSMIAELAKLAAASKAVADCKAELESAQRDLDAREASRTSAFVDHINTALSAFGAGFRLQDLKGKPSATRVVADFRIALADGGRVLDRASVAASASKGGGPRFDTVLSEGDRTTLALAVFFANCMSSPSADRVAVLDDPFTSLDSGRRATTIQHLRELAGSCAQLWVFSHDEFFLRDSLPRHATWLTLTEENGTIGFSTWDPEGACRTTYARSVARLEEFLARSPGALRPDDAWQKVRPILEAYLRFRFPKAWQHNEWLGDFVKKGRARDPAVPLPLGDVERIATWCGFSNPGMHGDPFDAGPPPTEAEVRNIVQAVVAFVQS